jgi:hypothetical protein
MFIYKLTCFWHKNVGIHIRNREANELRILGDPERENLLHGTCIPKSGLRANREHYVREEER